jgi:hypothetical protein
MQMLQAADKRPNIHYLACPAEKLPFEDKSVDVITTIAIIGYEYARIKESQQASDLIKKIGLETFSNYWGR